MCIRTFSWKTLIALRSVVNLDKHTDGNFRKSVARRRSWSRLISADTCFFFKRTSTVLSKYWQPSRQTGNCAESEGFLKTLCSSAEQQQTAGRRYSQRVAESGFPPTATTSERAAREQRLLICTKTKKTEGDVDEASQYSRNRRIGLPGNDAPPYRVRARNKNPRRWPSRRRANCAERNGKTKFWHSDVSRDY